MKIFFDTEFIDTGTRIDFISIGLVREDGETYYAEKKGMLRAGDARRFPQWHRDNVLPHLVGGDAERWLGEIGADLRAFCGETPEFWAWYGAYDWVALCQLYGPMLNIPKAWPGYVRDLKMLASLCGLGKSDLPVKPADAHNALADARWNADVYATITASAPYKALISAVLAEELRAVGEGAPLPPGIDASALHLNA